MTRQRDTLLQERRVRSLLLTKEGNEGFMLEEDFQRILQEAVARARRTAGDNTTWSSREGHAATRLLRALRAYQQVVSTVMDQVRWQDI